MVDSAKVDAISKWSQPKNIIEIWSFLGLAWYYRRFIEGSSNSYLQERKIDFNEMKHHKRNSYLKEKTIIVR